MKKNRTRYNDFDIFLHDAVGQAAGDQEQLRAAYDLMHRAVLDYHKKILVANVGGFAVLCGVATLVLTGVITLPAAFMLLSTPPGWVLAVAFGASAGYVLYRLYRDRRVLAGVVEVGKATRPRYEALVERAAVAEIDDLFREAVVALLVTPEVYYGEQWTRARTEEYYSQRFPTG